jgi:glycosyltransferase involved in cell wall biosynthesis
MNYPSFYQGDVFRNLVASGEVDLQVIFAKDLTPDRLDLGWSNDLAGFPYRFLDKNNKIADAIRIARSQRDRFHIMNGLWTERSFAAALVALTMVRTPFALYSEAPEPDLPRSMIKRLFQSGFARLLAPKATGALSISHLAVEFYSRFGIREHAIYPFGYFRSYPALATDLKGSKNKNRIEVIFAGQLIHRKGVDLLLAAMRPLFDQYPSLCLTLIGGGELLNAMQAEVTSLGLDQRIQFEGVVPPDKIRERVALADVLALPSRWDGWGVVINEALSVGVPVIVSDRCGAADLVKQGINGYVFRSEDVADLRGCLSEFLDRRMEWPQFRAESAMIGERISSEEVTPYLIKCLKHMTGAISERPSPPWTQVRTTLSF